jgi:hypothetical protein
MGLAKYFATAKLHGKKIDTRTERFFGLKPPKEKKEKKKDKTINDILGDLLK